MRLADLIWTTVLMLKGEQGKDYLYYHISLFQLYQLYHLRKN